MNSFLRTKYKFQISKMELIRIGNKKELTDVSKWIKFHY